MNVNLKKFNMASIADDALIVLIGKRNTGKSYLVKDMLYYKRDFPEGVAISATESANSFYQNMMPGQFIHEEYNDDVILQALKRQTLCQAKNKQAGGPGKTVGVPGAKRFGDTRYFLILDDCLFDNSWASSAMMRYVFMNGRHKDLLTVITMQYPLGIPPILRTNIDYIFILRENIIANRFRIYNQFAGMFPTFEIFCQIMDQCTENYECLVIHNGSKSNKIEDQVFWYKAEPHSDFKLGAKEHWAVNRPFQPARWLTEEGELPPSSKRRGRGGSSAMAVRSNPTPTPLPMPSTGSAVGGMSIMNTGTSVGGAGRPLDRRMVNF
jgi:hypothetical protein